MKTKLLHCFVAVLAIVLLSAPSTTAQSAATATVVVYRPYKFSGLPMGYALFHDSQELCRLGNGRYVTSTVPAGMVTLRSHIVGFLWPMQRERVLRFPAQAGQTYFVQTDASLSTMTLNMSLVPTAFAESNLQHKIKPSKCSDSLITTHP